MYYIFAYSMSNELLCDTTPYETEEAAWKAIQEIMKRTPRPKLAWVERNVDGHINSDSNSGS